jgi:hypothetical protein
VEDQHDFQLAYAVIGTIGRVNSFGVQKKSSPVWVEHLLPNMPPITFFEGAKSLMRIIVQGNDWLIEKEILRVLLSIQRQFLYKLDSNGFPKVKARLEGYQFIHDWYDPNKEKVLFDLFYHFHLQATKTKE